MSYEATDVPVWRSQGAITQLILTKGGSAVAFSHEPPAQGFQAKLQIDGLGYIIKITAHCRPAPRPPAARKR